MIKSVDKLREIFAVGNSFKKYNDFKRFTFDHACKEINDHYKMNLGYEEIKEKRKVVAIKFVFKKTRVRKVVNQKTGIEKNLYIKPEAQTKLTTLHCKYRAYDCGINALALASFQLESPHISHL